MISYKIEIKDLENKHGLEKLSREELIDVLNENYKYRKKYVFEISMIRTQFIKLDPKNKELIEAFCELAKIDLEESYLH